MLLKKPIYQILLFFLLLPQIPLSAEKSSDADKKELISRYDSLVSRHIEMSDTPGVAIAIVVDGQIALLKGYGVKKAGQPDKIDTQTVFRIASVSKGFASVLTGLLVEDGVLNWDDKISKYLPEFSLSDKNNSDKLTIRHILNHTSGLVPHAYDNLIEENVSLNKIVGKLQRLPSLCPAGECYGYQNALYSLIANIIKSATGKEYSSLLSDRILKPLGMNGVSFSKRQLISSKNYARPHERINWKISPVTPRSTYYSTIAASGLNASIKDMAQWLLAMLGNKQEVIPLSVIQKVNKPTVRTPQEHRKYNWKNRLKDTHYGMGWRIFDYSGHNLIYHSGNVYGYYAALAFLPDHNVGIVVLQNSRVYSRYVYVFLDMYLNIDQEGSLEMLQ